MMLLRLNLYERLMYQLVQLENQATQNGHHMVFQRLPSRRGVPGNETADTAAKCARSLLHTHCQVSLCSTLGKSRLPP